MESIWPLVGGKKRSPLLNASTDSLRRGSFKTMFANRHGVVPAERFYECREENGVKQPHYFARKDGKPIMFAGIKDCPDVKGDTVPSFAILTEEPNELVAPYHDRIPVVLDDPESTLDYIAPLGPEKFEVRPMNRAVNKVATKDIKLFESEPERQPDDDT